MRRLLEDVTEAGASKYYLQPVVVKPMADGRWELVDGQQRLTTLYLVLRSIRKYFPESAPRFKLSYETRPGSADYLDDPKESASEENIDYFHMYQAFTVIQAWFEEQANATVAAINLYQALSDTVYVIWYEAPTGSEFDSQALFTRLNFGRIPLTDAELVNASLLSGIERKHGTAAQWDSIERDLWSPRGVGVRPDAVGTSVSVSCVSGGANAEPVSGHTRDLFRNASSAGASNRSRHSSPDFIVVMVRASKRVRDLVQDRLSNFVLRV